MTLLMLCLADVCCVHFLDPKRKRINLRFDTVVFLSHNANWSIVHDTMNLNAPLSTHLVLIADAVLAMTLA